MLSRRAILSIQYTAAGPKAGKAVGGFLRYVHYRDHHNLGERDRGVGGWSATSPIAIQRRPRAGSSMPARLSATASGAS